MILLAISFVASVFTVIQFEERIVCTNKIQRKSPVVYCDQEKKKVLIDFWNNILETQGKYHAD